MLEGATDVLQYVVVTEAKASIKATAGAAYNRITGHIPPSTTPPNPIMAQSINPGLAKSNKGVPVKLLSRGIGLAAKWAGAGTIAPVVAKVATSRIIEGQAYITRDAGIDALAVGAGVVAASAAVSLSPIALPLAASILVTSAAAGVASQAVRNIFAPQSVDGFPQITKNWLADNDYPALCGMRDKFIAENAQVNSMEEKLNELEACLEKENLTPSELENAKKLLLEYNQTLKETTEQKIPQIIKETAVENKDRKNKYGLNFTNEVGKKIMSVDQKIRQLNDKINHRLPAKALLTQYKETKTKPTASASQKHKASKRHKRKRK